MRSNFEEVVQNFELKRVGGALRVTSLRPLLIQLSLFHFGSLSCKHADRIYSEPWVPVKMLILDAFLVLLG